ncbi:MAG TPA: hypothetical protein ENJ60_13150 [Aeromonadales bacterium]|nr:hypothetical protein [Aeromonadales bacterium]
MFSGAGWPMWQVWLLYIAVGLFSIGLIYYPLRKLSHWFLLFLLTLIAAIMFAPLPIESGSSNWAPAALVTIFEMEQKVPSALLHGLIPVLIMWVAFFAIGSAFLIKIKPRTRSKHPTNSETDSKKTEPEND